jgi:ankyrin repeat protein
MDGALASLPHDLDEAYESILNEIKEDGPEIQLLARTVLSWIFHSGQVRALEMQELQDLIATKVGAKMLDERRPSSDQIIRACRRLIVHDRVTRTVRFIHVSLSFYFEEHAADYILPISDLAMTCLTYLSFDEFKSGKSSRNSELRRRLNQYKAAQYVAQYWGHYVRASEKIPAVQSLMQNFLSLKENCNAMNQIREVDLTGGSYTQPGAVHLLAEHGLANTLLALINEGNFKPAGAESYLSSVTQAVTTALGKKPSVLTEDWDIATDDEFGWTALHMAALNGHEQIVDILLTQGADPLITNSEGGTALHIAAAAGKDEVIAELMKYRPPKDADKTDKKGELSAVAPIKFPDRTQQLLQARDLRARTALHLAALAGTDRIVEQLLQAKADPTAQDFQGRSPLHLAAMLGQTNVARVLVDSRWVAQESPGPSVENEAGRSTSDLPGTLSQMNIARVTLTPKEAVQKRMALEDNERRSALHIAAYYGHERVVEVLLEAGADPGQTDGATRTPLQLAALRRHEKVLNMLEVAAKK